MRKQVEKKFDVGDQNYTKPGEYFAEFSTVGEFTSIKKRKDDLTFETIVETPSEPAPTPTPSEPLETEALMELTKDYAGTIEATVIIPEGWNIASAFGQLTTGGGGDGEEESEDIVYVPTGEWYLLLVNKGDDTYKIMDISGWWESTPASDSPGLSEDFPVPNE